MGEKVFGELCADVAGVQVIRARDVARQFDATCGRVVERDDGRAADAGQRRQGRFDLSQLDALAADLDL